MRRLAPLLVLALVLGCDPSTLSSPRLSWRFVDERPCDLAGVVDVAVTERFSERRLETFRCRSGLAPASVQLAATPQPNLIELDGHSLSGVVLYHATVELDSQGSVPVTLWFIGGRAE